MQRPYPRRGSSTGAIGAPWVGLWRAHQARTPAAMAFRCSSVSLRPLLGGLRANAARTPADTAARWASDNGLPSFAARMRPRDSSVCFVPVRIVAFPRLASSTGEATHGKRPPPQSGREVTVSIHTSWARSTCRTPAISKDTPKMHSARGVGKPYSAVLAACCGGAQRGAARALQDREQ